MSSQGAAERDGNVSERKPFPPKLRLQSRTQFQAVYKHGRRSGTMSFTMFGLPNDVGFPRLGITVTRKVGNAVRRNRIKRVIREIFRQNLAQLDVALDLVVNAHRGIDADEFRSLEREFLICFRRLARGTRM